MEEKTWHLPPMRCREMKIGWDWSERNALAFSHKAPHNSTNLAPGWSTTPPCTVLAQTGHTRRTEARYNAKAERNANSRKRCAFFGLVVA